jgi:hypothetical protein
VAWSMHQVNVRTKKKRNCNSCHMLRTCEDTGCHEESYCGCIRIPFAAIFGFVVEEIGEHLLKNVGSISQVRSSGMAL